MDSNFIFNEKLKFSWGHIIAGIALIAIAYCTFVGTVYLTKGHFILSGIITFVVVLLLGLIFLIPQQLKATDYHFDKRIKWERGFIFASPVLFVLLMIPFSHAWTVHSRQDKILKAFEQALTNTTEMFNQYEQYSTLRMDNYSKTLERVYSDTTTTYVNKREILRLILLSSNYDTLKNSSKAWMDKSVDKKVTTWNVFLLGNITEIREAIHTWHSNLQGFSQKKLKEEQNAEIFDSSNSYIQNIDKQLDVLETYYVDIKGFSLITLLWLLLGYVMLLAPYLLQERHTKTIGTKWTLFGSDNNKKRSDKKENQRRNSESEDQNEQDDYKNYQKNTDSSDKNDYSAITI